GAGADALDFSGQATSRAVTLTGSGGVDGFAGTEAALSGGFTNVEALTGGTGSDRLTGVNADATWTLGASNQYTSDRTLGFAGYEQLTGGSGADTFRVAAASTFTLQGGAGADVF